MSATALLVCTRCRPAEADPALPRPGSALLAAAQAAARLHPQLLLRGIACLSGCGRPCAAAVLGDGKVGYLFGDLPPDSSGARDLITVALAHARSPSGYLPRLARPERLRAGILARLPPLHWLTTNETEIAWPA